jgi:hypothetical protein
MLGSRGVFKEEVLEVNISSFCFKLVALSESVNRVD